MTALDEGHLFGEIRALKQQNGVKEAEKMLNTLAIHVKPIMKKRGWKVGRLLGTSIMIHCLLLRLF